MAKQQYGDLRQSSGVTHVEAHPDSLTVHFGQKRYHYTADSAGREHIDAMKRLAGAGAGLAAYIRTHRPDHEKG